MTRVTYICVCLFDWIFFYSLYRIEFELKMHPVETLDRNKRSKVGAQTLMNDYNDETSASFWHHRAQHTLRNQLEKEHNTNIAKNIIFFLGDGMSIPTLAAARIYLGQTRGHSGEESRLSFESFPYTGLSKVRLPYIFTVCFNAF